MANKEPGLETVIIQKLITVEDLLKSFMASLKELPQKTREDTTPVKAPITGRIHWSKNVWNGKKIEKIGEYLGYVEFREESKGIWSPARGYLHIWVHQGWVSEGMEIAEIRKRFTIY